LRILISAVGAALALSAAVLVAPASSAFAQGKDKLSGVTVIPFEPDRLAVIGGGRPLRLNDDASLIPRTRIKEVPIVNGKMGEYVDLDGMRVHIPFGSIASAKMQFSEFRPSAANPSQMEPNPDYQKVTMFDTALGAVCAKEASAAGDGEIEMRLGRDRSITVVRAEPAAAAQPGQPVSKTYTVLTAMELRYLTEEPAAEGLYRKCLGGGAATRTKTAETKKKN
jgi:hypothetical protein